MTLLSAVFLGAVHGFAEFFPISSSGHLAVLEGLFNLTGSEGGHVLFNAMLHIASLIALLVFFRHEIRNTAYELGALVNVGPYAGNSQGRVLKARQFIMLFAGTLPLFLVFTFHSRLDRLFFNSIFVGVEFVLTGCVLYVSDKMHQGNKNESNMTVLDAVIIGICQCAGAIPGLSRVGITAAAGIANGVSGSYALKFAYLLSIPALIGSCIAGLVDAFRGYVDVHSLPIYFAGMAVAFITGISALSIMKKFFENGKFGHFYYYCWLIGSLSIILTMIF